MQFFMENFPSSNTFLEMVFKTILVDHYGILTSWGVNGAIAKNVSLKVTYKLIRHRLLKLFLRKDNEV